MATKTQERTTKVTECVLRNGEWHVAYEVREGDTVVENHVVGIDAASLKADPAHYQTEYPEAFAAVQAAQS